MNYDDILEQLELHEGYRKHPYKDTVGVLTIGIGRNLDHNGITREEALFMLKNDVDHAIRELRFRYRWFNTLDEIRQRVVVDMVFNLGIYGFSKFKNTISYIEKGMYKEASKNMLKSKWARQVGKRATRLAEMMKTGEDYK